MLAPGTPRRARPPPLRQGRGGWRETELLLRPTKSRETLKKKPHKGVAAPVTTEWCATTLYSKHSKDSLTGGRTGAPLGLGSSQGRPGSAGRPQRKKKNQTKTPVSPSPIKASLPNVPLRPHPPNVTAEGMEFPLRNLCGVARLFSIKARARQTMKSKPTSKRLLVWEISLGKIKKYKTTTKADPQLLLREVQSFQKLDLERSKWDKHISRQQLTDNQGPKMQNTNTKYDLVQLLFQLSH
ncbi:uncharacterized protein LOC113982160 [Pipra filicauda]|uniref:Uncharacterized protein LOC113982160 n=1 Tax=Pipra filicauda TaxID=649802 RepID=A0A7R5KKH8_9PASS|nr:uncharacterized protein LOC113982160 [Pipra filicauda]